MTKKSLIPMLGSLGATPSLKRFQNELSSLFNELFSDISNFGEVSEFSQLQSGTVFPKVNVSETENGYSVDFAIAGFDKDDVTLEFKDNYLTISADKKEDLNEEAKNFLRKEISYRSFKRNIRFPKKIDASSAVANYDKGIITLTVNKFVEEVKDNSVKISIN